MYCDDTNVDPLASFFALFALSFRFTAVLCFILSCSFFNEAMPLCSILCSLPPEVSWNIEILQCGFMGIFVSFLLGTFRDFFFLKLPIEIFFGSCSSGILVTRNTLYLLSPRLCFFVVLKRDLTVKNDNTQTS